MYRKRRNARRIVVFIKQMAGVYVKFAEEKRILVL
jgi:hypothetical protein